ncbi:MAG: hypothetical protein K0Q95_2095 [Bacteroidota bacterium]|jgi:hypothetical protein|nr:hypothetical protein [Bacteroidota bacterium]
MIDNFFSQLEYPSATINIYPYSQEVEFGEITSGISEELEFNGYTELDKYEKNLLVHYINCCGQVADKLKELDTKYNKLLFLQDLKQRNNNLLRIIKRDGSNNYYHKNLLVKNISESKEFGLPQYAFNDFLLISVSFINEFKNYLEESISFVLALAEEDFSAKVSIPVRKLKIDLSVDHISALFKILHEAKLLVNNNKVDIGRFIVGHFESMKKKDISEESVNNKFHSPEQSSLDFWAAKFLELRSIIQNISKK